MLSQHVILALIASAAAVPLNINLGAYSPALVVGDGEISLGSAGEASNLMATLASGAATGETANQGQQGKEAQPQASAAPAADAEKKEAAPTEGEDKTAEPPAARSAPALNVRTVDHVDKREAAQDRMAAIEEAVAWIKRDIAGFNAALGYARDAMKDTPKIELGTENAGVGILVNAGENVQANSAANGAKAATGKAKRGEVVAEESEAPKMTLVAITEV